ncbi:MAG: NAD-dependent epimerase/dehydratase family protein [Xanthobacteraceae bacterium]
MRVLITGATGFVGVATVPALARQGYQIRAAVRDNIISQFAAGIDIVRHGDLAASVDWAPLISGCDAVVHLAGITHAGPSIADEQYDLINRRATAELVSAAERAGVERFVFVSSIRAQSGPAADHILTETDEPQPTDAYGASKLAAEMAVRASNLRYTILRPALAYGGGVKGNLAALTRLAASPWPLPFGELTKKRSLLNRESLIDAIGFSLSSPAAVRGTFIVADRDPISFRDLVAALRRGLGRPPNLFSVPGSLFHAALRTVGRQNILDRLDAELIADPAKLIAAGWKPTIDSGRALEQLAKQMLPR